MKEAGEVPRFSGIASPKCRCTPEKVCSRCTPPKPGKPAVYIDPEGNDHYFSRRFFGKYKEPWNEAVRISNRIPEQSAD